MKQHLLISVLLASVVIPSYSLAQTSIQTNKEFVVPIKPAIEISPAATQRVEPYLLNHFPNAAGAFVEENGPSWVEWQAESNFKPGSQRILAPTLNQAGRTFVEENGPSWAEWQAESNFTPGSQRMLAPTLNQAGQAFVEESGPSWVEWQAESSGQINNRVIHSNQPTFTPNSRVILPQNNVRRSFERNQP